MGRYTRTFFYKLAVFKLTPCDVRRWQLAREVMDKYHLKQPDTNLNLVTIKAVPESMKFDDLDEEQNTRPFSGFSLMTAGYGGLHALAWNSQFPTHREMILWHVSALVVASPAALSVLLTFFYLTTIFTSFMFRSCLRKFARDPNPNPMEISQPQPAVLGERPSSQRSVGVGKILLAIFEVFGALAGAPLYLLYIFARGFLVYESFRTVFFSPPEVYRVPRWTQYLPHIS